MSIKLLLVFAVTEFLLSLTPGPAVFLVVSQGMKAGFKPSLRGTLGILSGNAIYFALSALGLGALLMASATLFQIIKYLGAAYLIFIGVRMLISKSETPKADEPAALPKRSLRLFSQGLITQLSNPKAIVFFTALLPQFVTPGEWMFEQFIILGLVSIAVEFPVLAAYGWVAERGGKLIPEKFASLPDRVAGVFLIGAGVGLAAVRKP
ncbi:MAG: LysE family translocator [Rubrivivax sp.]|nr:LysE family translocator [Pyrinomonadaceae bacterium]